MADEIEQMGKGEEWTVSDLYGSEGTEVKEGDIKPLSPEDAKKVFG